MQKDNYTDFDLELRRMLHDAEEEVPSRVWDAVSSELDRRDRRKVVALRWRRVAAGVAAAAAVLSGIFVFMDRGHDPEPSITAGVQEVIRQDVPQEETVPDIAEQIAASAGSVLADVPARPARSSSPSVSVPSAVTPAEALAPVIEEPGETPVQAIQEPEAAAPAEPEPETVTSKDEKTGAVSVTFNPVDPLAWDIDEDDDAGRRTSAVSLFGNAMTNDFSGTGVRQMRAPTSPANTPRTGVEEKGTPSYAIPLTFGVGFRFNLSDRWALGTGLNWTLLSSTFTGIYTEVGSGNDIIRSVNSEITHNIQYLGVPLNIYYNILNNRNLRFYVWGGGEAERGILNRYLIRSDSGDITYREGISGIQWSAAAGLGLEFLMTDHLGLYLDPSARYYFDCAQPSSIRTRHPFMLDYELGLRFNF